MLPMETSMESKGIDQVLSQLRAAAAMAKTGSSEGAAPASEDGADFAATLKGALDRVNGQQQTASTMAADFAAGKEGTELHEVMIALQKANVSFQEAIQVRNRLVTAYQEIMNIQV